MSNNLHFTIITWSYHSCLSQSSKLHISKYIHSRHIQYNWWNVDWLEQASMNKVLMSHSKWEVVSETSFFRHSTAPVMAIKLTITTVKDTDKPTTHKKTGPIKKIDELRHSSVDVNAFATSTACCDFDLWQWPPISNQVTSRDYWIFLVSLTKTAQAIHDILYYGTRSVQTNERTWQTDSPKTQCFCRHHQVMKA